MFNRSAGGAPASSSTWATWISPWVVYALIALVLWGIAGVLQKLATNHISSELSTVLFAAAFIPVAVLLMFTNQMTWAFSSRGWMLVLLYGALIGIGTLVLFAAYREGKASVVTALYALYPALTVLLAIPIFDEQLNAQKAVATGLALAAGVALSYEGQPVRSAEPVAAASESKEVVAR
jgi:bacterial/archaeal transporter family protein